MNESVFWGQLKNTMQGYWEANRIETGTGVGIPDVSYSIYNAHGWIELKWLEKLPANVDTKITIDHFTKIQKHWLKQRGRLAGHCWVFVHISDSREWFLFDWRQVDEIEAWRVGQWRKKARLYATGRLLAARLYAALLADNKL